MERLVKRIYITLVITWIYGVVWMLLEKIIDGNIVNRAVDDIVMVLFIPIIFIATEKLVN